MSADELGNSSEYAPPRVVVVPEREKSIKNVKVAEVSKQYIRIGRKFSFKNITSA